MDKNISEEPDSLRNIFGSFKEGPIKKVVDLNNAKNLVNSKNKIRTPKQIKFIKNAVQIQQNSWENLNIGFSTRCLVQANLPHRNPIDSLDCWARFNGNFCLSIQPLITKNDQGNIKNYGYPYGNIPRLIMIYLATEAIKTQQTKIDLGSSMVEFMHRIGLKSVTGGKSGSIFRFKDQIQRLLTARIHFSYEGKTLRGVPYEVHKDYTIASGSLFWWEQKDPKENKEDKQGEFLRTYVVLSPQFFNEIINHPVPINLDAISALKQSPLALDLYCWLTHRVSYLKKPIRISWSDLAKQVGTDYGDIKNFKKHANFALKKIGLLWHQLNIENVTGGFLLKSSSPHINKKSLFISKNSEGTTTNP